MSRNMEAAGVGSDVAPNFYPVMGLPKLLAA